MSTKKRWIIGAAETCDLRPSSQFVSARHCRLEFDGTHWTITDLGSTNGTYVNGVKIKSPTLISDDDVVTLGRSFPLPWPGTEQRPFRLSSEPLPTKQSGDGTIQVAGLQLEARHVGIDVGQQRLIDDISFIVHPGELVGVMGTSGAGKSTLLQSLVGATPPTRGAVLAGPWDLYEQTARPCGLVGYVPQDDIVHADLTVGMALRYAAHLRLSPDLSSREIEGRIDIILRDLDIASIATSRIGSPERRGISGGQRRRVNVALEMLTDPPILVLDEPTSGLSSTDAVSLMRLLRRLASAGKTVVLTIHQPNAEVLRLFDAIVVIAKDRSTSDQGQLVWYGPPMPDAVTFFDPASVAENGTCDPDGILRGVQARPVAQWRAAYLATSTYRRWIIEKPYLVAVSSATPLQAAPRHVPVLRQLLTLGQRMLAVKRSDAWNTALLLLQAPVIGTLVAAVFSSKTRTALEEATWADVSSALGMTAFLLALAAVWFGCANAAREIVAERAIFRRERMAGLSPLAYMGSKLAVLSAFCLVQCAVLIGIVAPSCGLQGHWGIAFLLLFFAAQVGTSLGLTLSALARTPEVAAAALPLLILPMVILGGILMPLHELPGFTAEAADLMPSRWAFEGLIVNEAAARKTLSLPDPAHPGSLIAQDIAARWFPDPDWRQPKGIPLAILTALWLLGVFAAFSCLQPRLVTRRRGTQ